ncbi:hypothetical protein R3I93_011197 [Phoxinus phoxinus]|uniref:Uncharacterized protein n=1 Tax=Phoxinus phoxinus TaxID=58324 RepID=A0AAN9H832_9TELE
MKSSSKRQRGPLWIPDGSWIFSSLLKVHQVPKARAVGGVVLVVMTPKSSGCRRYHRLCTDRFRKNDDG